MTKFLGVASESGIQQFLAHIKAGDREQLFGAIDDLVQQGVDLQNFAKQVLMYMDAHLFEDMNFLISLSEAFTEILGNLRYYPYPSIVYKVVLHKYINGDSVSAEIPVKVPVQAAPTIHHKPVNEAVPAPVVKQADPLPAAEQVVNKPVIPAQQITGGDNSALWEEVLKRIDKESLQKSLRDHSTINKIEENTVHIIVINKFTQAAIEKQENKQYLEDILSQILGKQTFIHVHFQNKDEFFGEGLGF